METISGYVLTFLINSLWQVAVVAATAIGCGKLLRRAPARFQHLLWVSALLLSVGLPLYSLLQKPEDGIFNFVARTNVGAAQTETNGAIPVREDAIFSRNSSEDRNLFGSAVSTLGATIVAFYFAYLLFRAFRFQKALTETRRIRRAAYERSLSPAIKAVVCRCQSAFGINRYSVLCSPDVAAPVTAGFFRPVIILPENLFDVASSEMLASAVGHETAHIKRRDFALNLIYEFLYLFISFHPAARLVKRQIDETRELACDEMVAERLLDGGVYARSLVNLAALLSKRQRTTFVMGIMNAEILETRVKRLIGGKSYASNRKAKLLLALASFSLAATCGVASTFSISFLRSGENRTTINNTKDITGVWQGDFHGLPGVELAIKSKDGAPDGTVTFYPLKRTPSGKLEVAGSTGNLPLVKPQLTGDSLSFKIERPATDDTVDAEMNFTGENEAVLKLESAEIKGGKNETKMTRIRVESGNDENTSVSRNDDKNTSVSSNDDENININRSDGKRQEKSYEKDSGRSYEKSLERKVEKDSRQTNETNPKAPLER